MQRHLFAFLWIFLALFSFSLDVRNACADELSIYVYDSLDSPGGLGRAIVPLFEKKYGCKLKLLASGDAGAMVGRVKRDVARGKPVGQIIWGLDQQLWPKFKDSAEAWEKWVPHGYDHLKSWSKIEPGFLPFDYGAFAFIADTQWFTQNKVALPESVDDLLKPVFKRRLILEHPRTSSPGLAFHLFLSQLKKEKLGTFWTQLSSQWLTLAPGWNQAYEIFTSNKAPLVWSYLTSQAYHRENGDAQGRFQAVMFKEGQPFQIEGAAFVRGSLKDKKVKAHAREFLEFLLSDTVQAMIPKKNWMLPVLDSVALPESFKQLPEPKKLWGLQAIAPEQVTQSLRDFDLAVRQVSEK